MRGYVAEEGGCNAYGSGQHNCSEFQSQLEAFTPERDRDRDRDPYPNVVEHWRWESDGVPNPMPSQILFNQDFQGQQHRPDHKLALDKQNSHDPRSRPNVDIAYGENQPFSQTFEALEHKFLDDIIKLGKEHNHAEDAEYTRHTEKITAINAQYQEQLTVARSRHASRRDEFLKKESQARQHQYHQAMVNHYPNNNNSGPNEPQDYSNIPGSAAVPEVHGGYNNTDSYRGRSRFSGGSRDHGFEPRGPYPAYDGGSRYY